VREKRTNKKKRRKKGRKNTRRKKKCAREKKNHLFGIKEMEVVENAEENLERIYKEERIVM